MALIIAVAIFLGGCAAPPKEVLIEKPAKVKDDLDLKLTDLTNQIINSLTETKRSRIAVIDFSDLRGNISEFGKYLSEELITRLFMTRRFEVAERQMLNKIIKEHRLSYTHFFDEESVKEIGKLLGVDAIASGSVTDLGRSVKVNARLIATETGSIFAVASVEIIKDETVKNLLGRVAVTALSEPKKPEQKKRLESKMTLVLTRSRNSDKGEGILIAPGHNKQRYTVFYIDTRSFIDGGTLIFEITLGHGESNASFDLFPEGIRIPTKGYPKGSLAHQYDVSKGSMVNMSYNFSRGQIFQFGATGNWFSREGSRNTYHFRVWVIE